MNARCHAARRCVVNVWFRHRQQGYPVLPQLGKRKARTPEQVGDDRRKERESYALRYPNRSAEKIEKDRERNRAKYQVRQAKLAEAERLKNVEGLDLKTGLQISLLAHRLVEGASLYDMRDGDIVYPKSQDPFAALRQLHKRFSPIVEAEQERISALADEQRTAEKVLLTERLRREEAKPNKQVRR
jgi:hypothetical protein